MNTLKIIWSEGVGFVLLLFALIALSDKAGASNGISFTDSPDVNLDVQVLPFAELEFLDDPALLQLDIPPPGSTIPSKGIEFVVTGNSTTSVSATPDGFVQIPDIGFNGASGYLGKAISSDNEELGYDIQLTFPSQGISGSPPASSNLPQFEAAGTSQLSADLTLTSGQRIGELHLIANPEWTPHGGIPLTGLYIGEVVLTVTAGGGI